MPQTGAISSGLSPAGDGGTGSATDRDGRLQIDAPASTLQRLLLDSEERERGDTNGSRTESGKGTVCPDEAFQVTLTVYVHVDVFWFLAIYGAYRLLRP